MTVKVLYNASYGGFVISEQLINLIYSRYGIHVESPFNIPFDRHDVRLISLVEEIGLENASGSVCRSKTTLKLHELEEGTTQYYIDEYDGLETVMTVDNIKWVYI